MSGRILAPRWWLSSALFCASAVSALITPSNTTTAKSGFQGTVPLKQADGQTQIAELVPLTSAATRNSIDGNLINTNFSNAASVKAGDIPFISCNPADYPGVDADRVFQDAYSNANISGVILYSAVSDYCNYSHPAAQDWAENFVVLSMTNKEEAATLHSQLASLPVSMKFFVKVQGSGGDGGNNSNNNNNNSGNGFGGPPQNPLGPSPSTAVAMIILYSITGIITALFLVIIVTGAIRAHRHPERYGPRDVLGRPRQSRARGLGRAILDTIPIVKFGEKEQDPAKPGDVELASTGEARDIHNTGETDQRANSQETTSPGETTSTSRGGEEQPKSTTNALPENIDEGISPAQPAAAMSAGKDSSSHDENLGCSICTEDFEKGQDLRVLPCDHKFHPECVDPWLLNVSGTCPLCRVDLRPVTSHDSSGSHEADNLDTPANADTDASHRRRTAFRDILGLRLRPNATPEERIYALRRLREQQRARGEGASSDGATATDESAADRRRSRRISVRLSDVFSSRTRRERSPTAQQGESSQTAAQQQSQPPSNSSPSGPSGPSTAARE